MRCACGAIGRVLPPDFGYEPDPHLPIVQWCGGNLGDGWMAFELLPPAPDCCPACHGRPGVHVTRVPTGRSD